jgi:hypothetical protein
MTSFSVYVRQDTNIRDVYFRPMPKVQCRLDIYISRTDFVTYFIVENKYLYRRIDILFYGILCCGGRYVCKMKFLELLSQIVYFLNETFSLKLEPFGIFNRVVSLS